MLRALLAKQAARNLTRRLKAESCKFDSFQECGDGSLTSLNNNNEYCFNSNDGFIFLNPVTITDQNGKESSGVYMAVGGCYKIKSTQPEKFQQTYFPVQSSYEVNENELKATHDYYLITRQEEDLYVKVKYDYYDHKILQNYDETYKGEAEKYYYYVFNPKNFTAEAYVNDDAVVYTGVYKDKYYRDEIVITSSESKLPREMPSALFDIRPKEFPTDWTEYEFSSSATVKIKGNNLGDFPQKAWKIKAGLFTKDTPDDDLPSSSLSAGAIAGIVIACVVVVGVIVFCVVWFVVLKKSCCCGKKNSDAASA